MKHLRIPDFNLLTWSARLRAIPAILVCIVQVFRGMLLADHIHLRVPGNMGLLGCLVQVMFPWKKKTAKYAGNWDWASTQPLSYRIQQRILRSRILSQRIQVLIYGHWPDVNRNLRPFFTATYYEKDIVATEPRELVDPLQLMFVGALVEGKNPMLSIKAVQALVAKGILVVLHMFGNGPDYIKISKYVEEHQLDDIVKLYGNQPAQVVRACFQKSHFLVFISESEGWPKVVAESMFWGCLPITTAVSCVPEMVDHGNRGSLVGFNSEDVANTIFEWMAKEDAYKEACQKAMEWARQFTLEKFEREIIQLL
ncbi:MAG TPA: glycosyltransferase [Phnomibacter sp.]|nr:glycosyltransferase [Phnomibacter sp.]